MLLRLAVNGVVWAIIMEITAALMDVRLTLPILLLLLASAFAAWLANLIADALVPRLK